MKIQATKLWSPLRLGWLCWCVLTATLPAAETTKITLQPGLQMGAKGVDAKQQAFLDAVLNNDVAGAKAALLADRSLAKSKTAHGVPVIIYAAVMGPEMTALLLEHGADPNIRTTYSSGLAQDYSPLDVAAVLKNTHTAEKLLKAGANPNGLSPFKETSLNRTFSRSGELLLNPPTQKPDEEDAARQRMAKLLMSSGADPMLGNSMYGNPVTQMLQSPSPAWLAVLAESAPDLAKVKYKGNTLLHVAAERGDGEVIRVLIGRKLDPEIRNDRQLTGMQMVALRTQPTAINSTLPPLEPVGYWNLLAGGAKLDPFSMAAMGRLMDLDELAARKPETVSLRHDRERSLLHWAAQTGQSHIVQWLLRKGLDSGQTDAEASLPLHLALDQRHYETAEELIKVTPKAFLQDKQGRTPLTIAIRNGHTENIAALIKRAPEAKEKQALLDRELIYFIGQGNVTALETLVRLGARAETTTPDGQTALHAAAAAGASQTRWLLELGLDANVRDKSGRTPLHSLVVNANLRLSSSLPNRGINGFRLGGIGDMRMTQILEIFKTLIRHGADIKAQDNEGDTVLHLAFQTSNALATGYGEGPTWLEFLLEQGADTTATNALGQNALMSGLSPKSKAWRASDGLPRVLKILKEHGDKTEGAASSMLTTLHFAAASNQSELVQTLLKDGADVNAEDASGLTPLMLALIGAQTHNQPVPILNLLLKNGADAARLDKQGRSIWQIYYEDLHRRPYTQGQPLLEAGISTSITNRWGQNALHLAAIYRTENIVAAKLTEAGAGLEQPDAQGRLPLHWLVDSLEGARFLINPPILYQTTNLNTVDQEGNTPLHLACKSGYAEAITSLVNRGADVTLKNKNGETPMWLSVSKDAATTNRNPVRSQHLRQAVHLLPKGVTNDIILSAEAGDLAMVKQFLMWEPRLLLVEYEGRNALHAAAFANQRETADYLLKTGAKMDDFAAVGLEDLEFLKSSAKSRPENWKDAKKLKELMMVAARRDNPKLIDWLVAQGGKPDETIDPHTGISALGWAMKLNLPQAVEALRRHGAKPTVFDAISLKRPDLIRELAPHHAVMLNRTNESGITPLLKAVTDRNHECVKALLETGADPNQETWPAPRSPSTPLQTAFQRGDLAGVDLLIQHGIDVRHRNALGFTPLHLATWHGSIKTLQNLIDRGADINERQGKLSLPAHFKEAGQTALHLAVIRGDPPLVDFLLKNGAARQATNNFGERPVDLVKFLKDPANQLHSFSPSPIVRTPYLPIVYPPSLAKIKAWNHIETTLLKEP